MNYFHSDDRPESSEQPIRARVPDHVSSGAFSTGVIVMTAQTEFILDFVQNLGRPHQIVSRVVMPHNVLPQLVDALQRNIDLYRSRWGDLPLPQSNGPQNAQLENSQQPSDLSPGETSAGEPANQPNSRNEPPAAAGGPQANSIGAGGAGGQPPTESDIPSDPQNEGSLPPPTQSGSTARQASAQEVYDDLKIRDELLSGSYANAVMIGHGPHEFSFDFITNFYPNSAVSARVFLAAGQVPRLYDSLKGTWDQLRRRMQPPPPGSDPPSV